MMETLGQRIHLDPERVADFCRRHHIRRLAIFGSALRPDFRADSDVDVLVEFERGHTPGYAFFSMQDELSGMFGRRVDLVTAGFLSPRIRDDVRSRAEDLFLAA